MPEDAIARKSSWQRINQWLTVNKEGLGISAAVVTLLILVIQTYQMSRQTSSLREEIDQAARQEVFANTLDAGKIVADNPVLWRQVTAAGDERPAQELAARIAADPDSPEALKAYQFANYFLDFYDYILSEFPISDYPELGVSADPDEGYVGWSNTIRDVFRPGSLMCGQLISNQRNYGSSYVERIRTAGLCPGL